MTQLFRIVAYVLNLNGDVNSKEDVIRCIENNRHPEFISVEEIEETDCGEWDDNHELNSSDAPYLKYFPDVDAGPLDSHLKQEYRRVRGIMMAQIKKNQDLENENNELKEEIEKLKKVKEFVATIKDLT